MKSRVISVSSFSCSLLLFLLCLVSSNSASAANKITGAFGVKFGESLKTLTVLKVSKTTDGESLYKIEPKKSLKFWDNYYVLVTPISHRVYSIWGIKRNLPKKDCEASLEAVAGLLERKYGVSKQEPVFSFDKTYFFEKGDGKIILQCEFTIGSDFDIVYDFYIKYTSDKWETKASKERIKLESKGVTNTEGL